MIKKLIFKLFLIISATTSLFAETASIDIEKSALNLVKIAVESYAMPGVTEFEKTQIDAMFLNDLKVSDRLEAVANPFKNGYDTPVTAAEMQTKGIELLIKYKITKTPRIDYSQGNNWDVTLDTMDDLHKPSLDEIGFQELITKQIS